MVRALMQKAVYGTRNGEEAAWYVIGLMEGLIA
jgi:hypothetical protein